MTDNEINQSTALKKYDFDSQKPTLLVLGGSLGSQRINALIASRLDSMVFSEHPNYMAMRGVVLRKV